MASTLEEEALGAEPTIQWKPLALTLVEYPEGDLFGKLLAVISLTPFAIIAGFVTLIIFRRDLHTISFFGGIIINDILNFILKHSIRQPRPISREAIYQEYGMPSSHSQFMWFFASYMVLFVYFRLHINNNSTMSEKFWRVLILAASIVSALIVGYSRIYLQYHTNSQVFWGSVVGSVIGVSYFILIHFFVSPLFPIIASWKASEYLLLRDTTLIPNILWFEYTNVRTEARARSRKLYSMKSQ